MNSFLRIDKLLSNESDFYTIIAIAFQLEKDESLLAAIPSIKEIKSVGDFSNWAHSLFEQAYSELSEAISHKENLPSTKLACYLAILRLDHWRKQAAKLRLAVQEDLEDLMLNIRYITDAPEIFAESMFQNEPLSEEETSAKLQQTLINYQSRQKFLREFTWPIINEILKFAEQFHATFQSTYGSLLNEYEQDLAKAEVEFQSLIKMLEESEDITSNEELGFGIKHKHFNLIYDLLNDVATSLIATLIRKAVQN